MLKKNIRVTPYFVILIESLFCILSYFKNLLKCVNECHFASFEIYLPSKNNCKNMVLCKKRNYLCQSKWILILKFYSTKRNIKKKHVLFKEI